MPLRSRFAAVAIVGGSLGALIAAKSPSRMEITGQNVFTFYRSFDALTKEPRRVSPSIATLCTTPTAEAIDAIKKATGPHHEARIRLFTNTAGQRPRRSTSAPFAVGATIVKEKLGLDDEVIAVGGMRKRPAGFDPANGDWEYFYASRTGGFSIGALQNCIACHTHAKATDYVFTHLR